MNGYISACNGQGMGLPATCSGYHRRHDPVSLVPTVGGNHVCPTCGVSYGRAEASTRASPHSLSAPQDEHKDHTP